MNALVIAGEIYAGPNEGTASNGSPQFFGSTEKSSETIRNSNNSTRLGSFGTVFDPTAQADDWNRKTKVTFSAPVEIPGVHLKGWGVLPAGTSIFKILDWQSDRHIVQIFNADETVVYATVLAIPNYRLQATDKTVITFGERPAGQPEALRAWFYPGAFALRSVARRLQ